MVGSERQLFVQALSIANDGLAADAEVERNPGRGQAPQDASRHLDFPWRQLCDKLHSPLYFFDIEQFLGKFRPLRTEIPVLDEEREGDIAHQLEMQAGVVKDTALLRSRQ